MLAGVVTPPPASPVRSAAGHGRGGRGAAVWEAVQQVLAPMGASLSVVDAGGGTGGLSVPLAQLGHRVTVVDPSPDSLAALGRRAAESGCSERVHGVQGDLTSLAELARDVDVVICHSVLEVVDDPAAALQAVHEVLRPGGVVSVVVAGRSAAVLARALAGRLLEALHTVRGAPTEPPRRFLAAEIQGLLAAAGFDLEHINGIGVFTGLVPGAFLDADPAAQDLLRELEREVAPRPEFLGMAAHLHLLARRP